MLNQNHIKYENIYAREKGIYSTYQKLKRYMSRGKLPDKELFTENNINRIYDRMGFAVLPYSVKDCYTVLALIHAQYERVSGEFDDYISNPKSSGYRALQTAVYLRPDDNKYIAEIQVKTPEMHKYNEYGPASHIAYKIKSFYKEDIDEDLYVFEDLQEWKEEISKDIDTDNQKFYLNIFDNNVFVFTKDGHIIRLEKGSTPLDFAYKIHTEVGDHCVGTKVNDKMVKFDYVLETGDVVEILTSKRKMVNRDWLGIVKENYTKQRIRRGITD
jgi:GTP pyrophosphokinase